MHPGELKKGMTVWAYRSDDWTVTQAIVERVWGFPSESVDLAGPDGRAFACDPRGVHTDKRLAQLAAREAADRCVRTSDTVIRETQARQELAARAFARLTDELVGAAEPEPEPEPVELGGEA